jgi:hypothetical protein
LFTILIVNNVINPLVAPRIIDQFIMSHNSEITPDESISQDFPDDVSNYLSDNLYDTSVPESSYHPTTSTSTTSGISIESRIHSTFMIVTEINKDSINSLLAVNNPSLCMLISSLNIKISYEHLKTIFHANIIGKNFMKLLNSHPKNPSFDANIVQVTWHILVDQIRKYPLLSKDISIVFVVKLNAMVQLHLVLLWSIIFSRKENHPHVIIL